MVHQSCEWVLLNKPEGYSVAELQEAYRLYFPAFHPVHRLDKDTSGLWLVATTGDANARLSAAFQKREVQKAYLAVCANSLKKKQGKIIGDMEKSRRSQWRLLPSKINPAETQFYSESLQPGFRLLLVQPKTGKTHQIRVAMKACGAPLLGDSIYNKAKSAQQTRLYLHASYLAFNDLGKYYRFGHLPTSGEYFQGEAFSKALTKLEQRAGVEIKTQPAMAINALQGRDFS